MTAIQDYRSRLADPASRKLVSEVIRGNNASPYAKDILEQTRAKLDLKLKEKIVKDAVYGGGKNGKGGSSHQ